MHRFKHIRPRDVMKCKTIAEKDIPSSAVRYYTDGGCSPSQSGRGGFGVIQMRPEKPNSPSKTFAYGYSVTTNNRMELLALIALGLNFDQKEYYVLSDS